MNEDQLLQEADRRGRTYVAGAETRRVFPSDQDIAALAGFDESLPDQGRAAAETIALMDDLGSPATVASNGPNYFGFVIGASLPVAAAAERLAIAWDQCASAEDGSPALSSAWCSVLVVSTPLATGVDESSETRVSPWVTASHT